MMLLFQTSTSSEAAEERLEASQVAQAALENIRSATTVAADTGFITSPDDSSYQVRTQATTVAGNPSLADVTITVQWTAKTGNETRTFTGKVYDKAVVP